MRDTRKVFILRSLCYLAIPLSLVAAACSGIPQTGTAAPASSPTSLPSITSSPVPVSSPSPLPGATPTPTLIEPTPTLIECTGATWSLDFTRSGGLAGHTASLHLTSSGGATAAQPDQNLVFPTAIPPDALTQVGKLLRAACPFSSSTQSRVCPDCFSYDLEIQMEAYTYSAKVSDVDLAGMGTLIQTLNNLLNQSLSSHP